MLRHIAVYCGASPGADPDFAVRAGDLAEALADRKLGLVYGGSRNGLMGVLADQMLAAGGRVVGVMPRSLIEWEQAHQSLTELITVTGMHERKQIMSDRADGFIAMPGGIGTLEEIFEMISWAQLGVHYKPCAFYNINGYYDGLFRFLDHSVEQGLMRPQLREMLLIDENPEQLLQRMVDYRSPVRHRWIDSSET